MKLLLKLHLMYCVQFYVIIVSCHLMVLTEEQTKLYLNEDTNPCAISLKSNDVLVNCSHRSLKSINGCWFPENTTKIWLNNNRLTVIPNGAISHMLNLTEIHFENNVINFIESQALMGLRSLQYLNLDKNQLNIFNLSIDIFSHLISLTDLHLIQTYDCDRTNTELNKTNETLPQSHDLTNKNSFPDQMFANLTNLISLSLNVSSNTLYFNEYFENLKHLINLQITGCVNIITDESFQHVKYVKNLVLTDLLNVHNFSDLALGCFKNLSQLTYSFVQIKLPHALNTLRPLVNTSLTYLEFNGVVVNGASLVYDIINRNGIIDRNSFQYLRHICIEELHLNYCHIMIVTQDAFSGGSLENCLKYISFSTNPIAGYISALQTLLYLKNLKTLIVTGYSFSRRDWESHLDVPTFETRSMLSKKRKMTKQYKKHFIDTRQLLDFQNDLYNKQNRKQKNLTNNENNLQEYIFGVSDSLEYVDISALFQNTIMNLKCVVQGGKNVTHLYVVDNGLWNLQYPIEGLSKLKIFSLSYNNLSVLNVSFFNVHPNLEEIFIDNSMLNSEFMSKYSFTLFQNLHNLHTLDLSQNSLSILSLHTFLPNKNLTWLNLAANRFRKIPFDLKLTPKLNYLDLRQNALTTVDETEREELETITQTNSSFHLFLSGNILSCGCEHIPFLQWLQQTNIRFDDNRNYTCMNNKGVLSFTLAYSDLDGLWRECWGQVFFNVSIVLLCLILIGFLLVFIYMKNKTLILSTILQWFTGYKLKKQSDYKYGVFIDYTSDNFHFACFSLRHYIENELKLTTFLQDRDLTPGIGLAYGVSEAIFSSWRVLLVINDNFLNENDWFLFTIRSSVHSIIPDNPSRVVILVDKKYSNQLPTELLSAVPDDNVFEMTEFEITYKLQQFLRTRLLCMRHNL